MPELRNVRAREAIAALERAGGVARRGKGDHVNIKMPNGQIITLSGKHEAIKIQTSGHCGQWSGLRMVHVGVRHA